MTTAQADQGRDATSVEVLIGRFLSAYLAVGSVLMAAYASVFTRQTLDGYSGLALVALAAATANLVAFILYARGNRVVAGAAALLIPVVPVLYFASAASVDAGFGELLYIVPVGVFVVLPDEAGRVRFFAGATALAAILTIQVAFPRSSAWQPMSPSDTYSFALANRTLMIAALFVMSVLLHRKLVRANRLVARSLAHEHRNATTDALTGLKNRRPLVDRVTKLAQQGGYVLAIADLDGFKVLNDTFGHACGDTVLREVAGRFKVHMRGEDVVGRWGGEEFLFVLEPMPIENAAALMERIRASLESFAVPCAGHVHEVTASFGVAVGEPGDRLEHTYRRADHAMYRAKAAGRNAVRWS